MDDSIFKAKYQKYKYKVKIWEKDFKEKHGRIPSKHDIREAPTAIRDSYRMYYKLKTTFLEETLSEALEDDSFDLSILDSSSQDVGVSFSEVSSVDITQLTNSTLSMVTDRSGNFADISSTSTSFDRRLSEAMPNVNQSNDSSTFDAEKFEQLNEKAWGSNITNNERREDGDGAKRAEITAKVRQTVADKLFRNSSFSKRNPRKSLSKSSLRSSGSFSSQSSSQKELLPDLETILSQKSQNTDTEPVGKLLSVGSTKATTTTLDNLIDLQWLNRCNSKNTLDSIDSSDIGLPSSTVREDTKSKYGISNINLSALPTEPESVTVASMIGNKTMLSFDLCNLKLNNGSDSPSATVEKTYSYSDEDEIANSEEESNVDTSVPQIRSIRHVLKKRKLSESHTPTPQATAVVQEHPPQISVPVESTEEENSSSVAPKATKPKKPRKLVKKRATTVNAPVVRRRSGRVTRIVQQKSETFEADSDGSNEVDPFAEDDSDADPDFLKDYKNGQITEQDLSESNDSGDESAEQKPKTTKTVRKATKKSTEKLPKVKTKRIVIAKKAKTNITKNDEDDDKDEKENQPDEYQMDFGMDTIKSVPRIDIAELTRTTAAFTEYVHKQITVSGVSEPAPNNRTKEYVPSTKQSQAREKLEKKIAAGTLDENFVRINLRKKVFVRGKKTINFSRYKKTQWRQKKAAALAGPDMDMGGCDGGILTCFQCGQPGHFAQNCKIKSDRLLPLEAYVEESPFPTLEEIEQISNEKVLAVHGSRSIPAKSNPIWKESRGDVDALDNAEVLEELEANSASAVDQRQAAVNEPTTYIGHKIPDEFLLKAGLLNESAEDGKDVKPIYKLKPNGSLPDTPKEVFEALKMFGHEQFRSGQEKAVMRILSGQSSLVTLSTGSGKSLCYQLPAYIYSQYYKCITLVISPLVSLMEDQVHGVPHFLNAQCLHTNQKKDQRQKIIDMIKAGSVHVLLISPEAVVAGEKSTGFGSILRDLPPIAFVCIDEAHCVSQWSHNFRPSYLMVCRVLHETMKVKTILGLTATATKATRQSIVKHLSIPDGLEGVISDIPLPDNLTLTVSSDDNRDLGLIRLLKHDKFEQFKSIIIYCTRRDECESVAKHLRTVFQDSMVDKTDSKKRKRGPRATIEPYHAGMPASRRKSIQNAFMRGDLKIVVATVAFGMGINKADIRAVIHYNMPNNFERYVQEVGRAGRDGKSSHCHLFLDSKGGDKMELRRHIFANSIDRHIIRKLLQKVFIPCACVKNGDRPSTDKNSYQSDIDAVQNMSWTDDMESPVIEKAPERHCPGHEVCFSVDGTVNELDLPEENIATLLCYLELHENKFIKVLSRAYTMCKVFSYGGAKALRAAAQSCPPLAMAIALDLKKGISHEKSTFIEFPVIDIASAIGWNSGVVKYQLKNLEWTTVNGMTRRSTISVEFSDLGFRIRAPGDLSGNELDSTLDMLHNRVKNQEKTQLIQLDNVFNGLTSIARKSCVPCANVENNDEYSEKLKKLVREYFQSDEIQSNIELSDEPQANTTPDALIISDIRTMIFRYPENNFTGRSLARIFHGVSSPVFPAVIWGRCKYWRAHIKTDFNRIVALANAEIIKIRT